MKNRVQSPVVLKNSAIALVVFAVSGWACAQSTPVGRWQTIDDKTQQVKSEVLIEDKGGTLIGKIAKVFTAPRADNPDRLCRVCTDDRKDKPALGLEIIRGAKKDDDAWTGGKILDPESGKEYRLRMWPEADGKTLNVRGYIGPVYRTQQWKRVD